MGPYALPMSRRDAALRGAGTAVLWALLAVALLASIGEGVRGGPSGGRVEAIAEMFLELMEGSGPLVVTGVVVSMSAIVGAGMGLLAARLRLNATMRAVVLALAALPALWLVIAGAWTLLFFPWVVEEPASAPWFLVVAFFYSGVSIFVAAPVLVTPAVLAAVLLEGWTRPEQLRQTGLANPTLRRRILWVLVMLVSALTTFAARGWFRK